MMQTLDVLPALHCVLTQPVTQKQDLNSETLQSSIKKWHERQHTEKQRGLNTVLQFLQICTQKNKVISAGTRQRMQTTFKEIYYIHCHAQFNKKQEAWTKNHAQNLEYYFKLF